MCKVLGRLLLSFFVLVVVSRPLSHAKVLKCPQIDLLNIAFQGFPYALARLKIAHRSATQTEQLIRVPNKTICITSDVDHVKHETQHSSEKIVEKASEKAAEKNVDVVFIKEQLHKIFEPVKEFFAEIRHYSFLIKPLLEKSMIEKNIKKLHLMKFMNSSMELIEFFEHEITSKEKLSEVCDELKTFLTDIEDSLSAKTNKIYMEFVQDIKRAKKNISCENKTPLRFFNVDYFDVHDEIGDVHERTDIVIEQAA